MAGRSPAPKGASRRREESRRRLRAVRAAVTAATLALLFAFALVVGDKDYHASAFGWMPFFAGVLLVATSFAYQRILVRSLSFSDVARVGQCRRSQSVSFSTTFSNRGPLPFFSVDAVFSVSEREGNRIRETATTLSLGPFETYEMGFDVTFEHVGAYWSGLDRVVVRDFLGLFETVVENRSHQLVRVSPCVRDIPALPLEADAETDVAAAEKAKIADSMDYAQVREYAPGDPLKTVHWKLSARAGELYTRMYEVYNNPTVAVFMGFHAPVTEVEDALAVYDAVVECALSAVRYANGVGMEAELLFVDRYRQERKLPAWNIAETDALLADLPFVSDDPRDGQRETSLLSDHALAAQGQSNIVVCTADLGEGLVTALLEAKVRRRSPYLFAVVPKSLVGAELDAYCALLGRLDDAGVRYTVLSDSSALGEVGR